MLRKYGVHVRKDCYTIVSFYLCSKVCCYREVLYMDEKRRKENVKMSYRLVKDGDDVELHQEMIFRFSPNQVEHLVYFL